MKVTFTFKSGKSIELTAEEAIELKGWLDKISGNIKPHTTFKPIKPLEFAAPENDDGLMEFLPKQI